MSTTNNPGTSPYPSRLLEFTSEEMRECYDGLMLLAHELESKLSKNHIHWQRVDRLAWKVLIKSCQLKSIEDAGNERRISMDNAES
jgi:hypothetical protein